MGTGSALCAGIDVQVDSLQISSHAIIACVGVLRIHCLHCIPKNSDPGNQLACGIWNLNSGIQTHTLPLFFGLWEWKHHFGFFRLFL